MASKRWMNEYQKIIDNIDSKLPEILNSVPKIPGTPCFFLKDLRVVYKNIFKRKLDSSLFKGRFNCVRNHPFKMIPSKHVLESILYDKREIVDEGSIISLAKEYQRDSHRNSVDSSRNNIHTEKNNIHTEKNNIYTEKNNIQTERSISKKYTLADSDSSDSMNFIKKYQNENSDDDLKIIANDKLEKYDDEIFGNGSSEDSLEIIASNKANNKTSNKTSKNDSKIRNINPYEDIDDDEDNLVSRFTSPLVPNPSNISNQLTFSSLKSLILESFSYSPVCPVDSMRASYCEVHKVMFDYKTAPCNLFKHPHPTLSKYLKCHHPDIELTQLNKLYAIRQDPLIKNICQRRFIEYQKKSDDPLFALSVEACCVNLFSTRVTISFNDFVKLFEIVYGSIPYKNKEPFQEFLCNLRSPNIVIVKRDGTYFITLCPTRHSRYLEWKSKENHRKIDEIESRIILTDQPANEMSFKPRFSSLLFSNPLSSIAELNIPRRIQMRNPAVLENGPTNEEECYLFSMINFDGKRPYFTNEL